MVMRFKVGDKVWHYFVGLTEAEVIGVYPNTNRYKVKNERWEQFTSAKDVYGNPKEYYQKKLGYVNDRIKSLEKEKEKLLEQVS